MNESRSRSAEPADRRTTSERPAQPHLLSRLELPRPFPQRDRSATAPSGRPLLVADLVALAASALVSLAAADEGVTLAVALYALIFAGLAGLAGLYDRDRLVLSRSVLEEIPSIVQLAGVAALGFWLLAGPGLVRRRGRRSCGSALVAVGRDRDPSGALGACA